MGIHELMKVIGDEAPDAVKEEAMKNLFGRRVAVDASMSLYQFLISIRQGDGSVSLTDSSGEATSHILGMFYRTIRMAVNGIRPVYVFDGRPPTLKSGELAKRSRKAKEAKSELGEARDEGNAEEAAKLAKRTTRVTREQNEEVKRLFRLMGVPVVEAPCEAEAQCAAMARAGLVWGVGTEDMDSLTHGSPIVLRHMHYSEARKEPVIQIHLDRVLAGLGFDMAQFVDLCILLGCDYCDTIRGIGRKRAVELIRKHRTIEAVLQNLDHEKHAVPENFPFAEARELFLHPEVTDPAEIQLRWTDPDEEGLVQFLVREKGFNEDRVRGGVAKLRKARTTTVQGRLDGFFAPSAGPAPPSPMKLAAAPSAADKRKQASGAKKKDEVLFSRNKKKKTK